MLRLVIFDFDGVIADSEPAHFEMFSLTLLSEGIHLSRADYYEKYLGYDDEDCFTRVLADYGRPSSTELVSRLAQKKQTELAHYMEGNCVIMPGVKELLDDLQGNKVRCAICSGAVHSEIEFILKQAQLRDYFIQITSADDVSTGKPDPQGYQLSLSSTNALLNHEQPIEPSECVVIEDSTWGIQAAKAADMSCLAVTTSYPKEHLCEADLVVDNLTSVNTILLKKMLS